MSKLIIQHGERVTEHVLDEHPLVVGRDPQCDLFFADKKLSRRHARFESSDEGVRLVDLGSRNGCWVNEERVDERMLTSSDAVRLGGLSIQVELERESAPDEDRESTVYLSAESSADDSSTVVLSSKDLPDAPPDDAGTVILSANETSAPEGDSATRILPASDTAFDEDPTLKKPDVDSGRDRAAETLMLEGEGSRAAPDTGTVIFRGKTAPSIEGAGNASAPAEDATRIVPEGGETETRMHEPPHAEPFSQATGPPSPAPRDEEVPSAESPWVEPSVTPDSPRALRFAGLVAAVAALAFLVLAMPLMRTLGGALATESSLRGRALVDLLAATNEDALRENRPEALALDRVASEPGVVGAYILDPMGRVLAPEAASGSSSPLLASLGVDVDAKDIRAFREAPAGDGATVYALPIRAQGRRLGVAVLHYRTGAALSRWNMVMLALGSLLLVMGVAAAVLMARRWTLSPVRALRDDVEALRQGFVESVAEDRPYSDLAMIARSFNELVRQLGGDTEDGSETFKPMVDPTLVPEEREQAER